MDLARQEGNVIYIYDWKTGTIDKEELRQQLGIYGLYVRHVWPEAAANALRGIVYGLAENQLLQFDLDAATLQTTQKMVETSIDHLQGLLLDPQANLAERHQFSMIDDLEVCQQCQFRELCGR